MFDPPKRELLKELILHGRAKDPDMLEKLKRAWKMINRKGMKDLGKKNCVAKDMYRIWVKERVLEVKLHFLISLLTCLKSPEPEPVTREEVDKM